MHSEFPEMELRVGNKYRLGRKIGSGSFGDIYLGKAQESFLTLLIGLVYLISKLFAFYFIFFK